MGADDLIEESSMQQTAQPIDYKDWILIKAEIKTGLEIGLRNQKRYLVITLKKGDEELELLKGGKFETDIPPTYTRAKGLIGHQVEWSTWNPPKGAGPWSHFRWFDDVWQSTPNVQRREVPDRISNRESDTVARAAPVAAAYNRPIRQIIEKQYRNQKRDDYTTNDSNVTGSIFIQKDIGKFIVEVKIKLPHPDKDVEFLNSYKTVKYGDFKNQKEAEEFLAKLLATKKQLF